MNAQRMVGIVLLVVGVVLLVVGLNASDSLADRISDTFTGKWTDKTSWYVYGGLAAGLLGLLVTIFGRRSSTVV
jgi:uncharacterized membrane protein